MKVATPATRTLRWTLALLGVITALGMTGFGWLMISYAKRPGPGPAEHVSVPPPAELGLTGLARHLHEAGAIRKPHAFRWLLRVLDAEPRLRDTRTVIRLDQSVNEMLPLLVTGRGDPLLPLMFPEGFTRFDFARRVSLYGVTSEAGFLAATHDPELLHHWDVTAPTAEGYLFPDTYELRVPTSPDLLVRRLMKTFQTRLEPLWEAHSETLKALERDLGFTRHDVVTLASVVEKEAQLPRERPVIAGVFLNRLRDPDFRPHRLQADPTVAYGCLVAPERAASCAEFDGKRVTAAMVRDPLNPYNTYRHDGLPPGPICNPGVDSVRAVLQARDHDYYYFVARGDGSHRFSRSLSEHNRAIQEAR